MLYFLSDQAVKLEISKNPSTIEKRILWRIVKGIEGLMNKTQHRTNSKRLKHIYACLRNVKTKEGKSNKKIQELEDTLMDLKTLDDADKFISNMKVINGYAIVSKNVFTPDKVELLAHLKKYRNIFLQFFDEETLDKFENKLKTEFK